MPGQAHTIVGRAAERDFVRTFLESIESAPAILVLEGESGIGKTVLWRDALALARERGHHVLECRPAQSEAQLAFTAVGDLLDAVPDPVVDELPPPQRRALDVARLRAEPDGDEMLPRSIGVGMLGVLCALARTSPVLVGIDDEQWLDAASQRVLSFVLRRLRAERIGVLLARRVGGPIGLTAEIDGTSADVQHLHLRSLDDADLERVIREQLGGGLDRRSTAQLVRSSGGNPLMAVELGRALMERGPGEVAVPIPSSLQQLVDDRLLRLEPAGLDVVRVAAALSRPSAGVLGSVLGTSAATDGLAAAAAAGVLTVEGDRVQFAHPLLATAAYSQLAGADRCVLHARIAAVVDDVEERGRHLALSTTAPDDAVAAAVEAAARRARARGAPDSAAELWAAAARLTPADDRDDAHRRRFDEAQCVFESGDVARSRTLFAAMLAEAPSGAARAHVFARLGWVIAHLDGYEDAVRTFEAGLVEVGDDVAAEVELEQGLAWALHSVADLDAALPHSRRALELAQRIDDPGLLGGASTQAAFLESLAGAGLDIAAIEKVVDGPDPTWPQILGRPAWLHAVLLQWDDRLPEARERFLTMRQRTVDQGDEQSLPFILFQLARIELLSGDWEAARRDAHDCMEMSIRNGQVSERAYACAIEALVDAHAGRVDTARLQIADGLEVAIRLGVRPAELELLATRGFLELSLSRYEDADRTLGALAAAAQAAGLREPAIFRYHGDAIEAKIALGRLDEAEVMLADLEAIGRMLNRAWIDLVGARCGALLRAAAGDLSAATRLVEAALADDRVGQPFERARTLLASGSIQRRDRKKSDARDALHAAADEFRRLGAGLWVAKVDAELARVGGRPPSEGLTPTELAVAERIAAGRTYRETAAELFISPKTVQWNLSKVYRKLGIRSRAELPGRLDGD